MGGGFPFFFLFKWTEGKGGKQAGGSGSGGAAGTALPLLPEEPSLPWQQRGGAWACSVLLVRDSSVEGSVPLVLLCLLLCFNAFAAEKEIFVYTRTKERKEGFVNEISVKSRMCSLGVKSKSHHHSFIYFHFLKS